MKLEISILVPSILSLLVCLCSCNVYIVKNGERILVRTKSSKVNSSQEYYRGLDIPEPIKSTINISDDPSFESILGFANLSCDTRNILDITEATYIELAELPPKFYLFDDWDLGVHVGPVLELFEFVDGSDVEYLQQAVKNSGWRKRFE